MAVFCRDTTVQKKKVDQLEGLHVGELFGHDSFQLCLECTEHKGPEQKSITEAMVLNLQNMEKENAEVLLHARNIWMSDAMYIMIEFFDISQLRLIRNRTMKVSKNSCFLRIFIEILDIICMLSP